MRIPDAVRKCVVFLGVAIKGEKGISYGGTGFFVLRPSSILPNFNFVYLVTAKHVADQLNGQQVYIRANSTDGKAIDFNVDMEIKWWLHPTDAAADVAVFPLAFPIAQVDYKILPMGMFLTENIIKEKGFGAGDEVFITGLFALHVGKEKNLPIIRTGNVALMPDEKIPVTNFGLMDAYLIESRSIGGLSGSPVFILPHLAIGARQPFYLMGLIHGHWELNPESIIDTIAPDAGIKAGVNVGIAIVTPAQKILDILNRPELAAMRDEEEKKRVAQISPTPD